MMRVALKDMLEMVPWRAPSTLPPAGMIYGEQNADSTLQLLSHQLGMRRSWMSY